MRKKGPRRDELIRTIGEPEAERVLAAFAGRDLYVPLRPPPDSELVRALGPEVAFLLAKYFGGGRIRLPRGRRARILSLRQEGLTAREIAESAGCTERYVFAVLREQRSAGNEES